VHRGTSMPRRATPPWLLDCAWLPPTALPCTRTTSFVFRCAFVRIPLWLETVEATNPDLPRVLVGNKSDGETEVSAEEAVAFAQQHGCKYFETSAIRNDQVPEAFSSLIARIVAQIPNPPEPSLLLRKRIQIGKSLAENKSFRAALFDMA
jgi:GTPase SAR1 family protein